MTAARTDMARPERIRAEQAASILGISLRSVQEMAARGELPGCAKIGKVWTFDEEALRRWIREKQPCQAGTKHRPRTRIGADRFYGAGSPSTVGLTEKAYAQAIQRLRSGGSPR